MKRLFLILMLVGLSLNAQDKLWFKQYFIQDTLGNDLVRVLKVEDLTVKMDSLYDMDPFKYKTLRVELFAVNIKTNEVVRTLCEFRKKPKAIRKRYF
ncbi:MAG: hypothetical protein ACWA5P_01800 [bacterium]